LATSNSSVFVATLKSVQKVGKSTVIR